VAVLALGIAVSLAAWVAHEIAVSGGTPGPLAVIAIVAAGFALTVFVFHLSRIGPALALRRRAVPEATIMAHLAHVDGQGATPPDAVVGAAPGG
jgi:hypothetical protein